MSVPKSLGFSWTFSHLVLHGYKTTTVNSLLHLHSRKYKNKKKKAKNKEAVLYYSVGFNGIWGLINIAGKQLIQGLLELYVSRVVLPCLNQLLKAVPALGLWACVTPTSASVITLLSLPLLLLSHCFLWLWHPSVPLKNPCDYTGPIWIIQDNISTPRSLTSSVKSLLPC